MRGNELWRIDYFDYSGATRKSIKSKEMCLGARLGRREGRVRAVRAAFCPPALRWVEHLMVAEIAFYLARTSAWPVIG